MKSTMKIAAAVMTAALALGVASQASAMSFDLNNGYSSSQAVGGKDHYILQVQSPTRIEVASQAFIPTETAHIHVRAVLRDDNGSLVTMASRQGNNFVLDRQVQPGTYTLEVESWNTSAKQQGANRYQLHADF
ncbi:hypothetical protein HOP52_10190 [Halomonas campisalis]|uniref:Uncharacterized protein n=1 Tax=Billgrantia campisalis TaxID=74661 RepID=A0ABS9P9G5_9GAMM|nr:hypothetical protein [Halomonas campisalis]MCG6658124.1 hypothetical protein [Halomonas campisalis]MDR5862791.1 hypothetical protein [Halomonas campisalis]